jgi:hypothetical protein
MAARLLRNHGHYRFVCRNRQLLEMASFDLTNGYDAISKAAQANASEASFAKAKLSTLRSTYLPLLIGANYSQGCGRDERALLNKQAFFCILNVQCLHPKD